MVKAGRKELSMVGLNYRMAKTSILIMNILITNEVSGRLRIAISYLTQRAGAT
jgi:hypothetical protein